MIPFKPIGVGQVAAMHVFRVYFSQALSTNPKLQAWDDYTMSSVLHTIFTGTSVNGSKPMVAGIGCTTAPSANWWPVTMTAGATVNNASRLKGNSGFCLLSATAPGAGGSVYFNVDFKIPSDLMPSDSMGAVLAVEYQFTGDTPSVIWYANKGTEGSPVWEALTPGVKGSAPAAGITEIRPCNAGEGYDGTQTYKLAIPDSGEEFPEEIWLKEYVA